MKDIKTNTLCTIISMISVVVMFIWGYMADSFEHCWLAVMIGGIIVISIRMIRRDKEESAKEKEDKE